MKIIESWNLINSAADDADGTKIDPDLFQRVRECLESAGIKVHGGSTDVGTLYRAFEKGELVQFSRADGSKFADGNPEAFTKANIALQQAEIQALFQRNDLSIHYTSPGLFLADPRGFFAELEAEQS